MPGAMKKTSNWQNKNDLRSNSKSSHKHRPKASKPKGSKSKGHADIEKDLPNIRTNRYIPRELTLALRKNADSSCISRLTGAQRRLVNEPLPNITNERQLLKLIHNWMPIFDNAFFFGAVCSKIKSVRTYNNKNTEHSTEGVWYPDTREIRINIDIEDQPTRNAASHMSTLAHEMLHAFLDVFSCGCHSCGMTGGRPSRLGESGHGAVWANAMCAIAAAITRDLGFEADCGIKQSVRLEMQKTAWQPRPDQFERWNLEYINLEDLELDLDDDYDKGKMEYKLVICAVM